MRCRKLAVYLFTLLLAAVAVFLWRLEPQAETLPVSLILSSADEEQVISCWKNAAGEYWLFLPGYVRQDSARLRLHAGNVRIDGAPAADGMSCEAFALDTPYSFSFRSKEGEVHTSLTFVQSRGLPTLFLDTASGSMDHIHARKGNREPGRMRLYTPGGETAYTGNLDEINGRGNDWLIPKKSYSLELASGADLLEMGQAEKWILQSNAFDGSHLRNKLIYDFAHEAGLAHSPQSRWVDLYLNGEYAGLYLLCERNELQAQRVALEGEGAYLVSMDVQWRLEQNGRPFVTTASETAFRIHDALAGEGELRQLLQSVENAISADDGVDSLTGKHWRELIDPDSWARKVLLEELFGNGDCGSISQYFYGSTREGPVYAGPVWDYDISMGNRQSWRISEPNVLLTGRVRMWSQTSLSWYYELCQQEDFRERMTEIYREEYLPLLDTFLRARLAQYTAQIAEGSAMNQLRWPDLGAYQQSAAGEAEAVYSYMQERIAFLNQLWLEEKPFCKVLLDPNDGGYTVCLAIAPGERLPELPENQGWYTADSQEPFDITQPIYEDMALTLR